MTCRRCGSPNVVVVIESKEKTKHRGCIGWFFWLIFTAVIGWIFLIIPLLTNSKTKKKNQTVAICQSCGRKWRV